MCRAGKESRQCSVVTAGSVRRIGGFTLMELLVVIAVVTLLLALTLTAIRKIRGSGAMTRELSAARQLMLAYNSYAMDHRGVLMPGYYELGEPLPVFDEAGNRLQDPLITLVAARYPWRHGGG